MPRRRRFRYCDEFVVVKPIRISSDERLLPGDAVEKERFRRHQLRRWYFRMLIGVPGDDWTTQLLKRAGVQTSPLQPKGEDEDESVTWEEKGAGWYTIYVAGQEVDTVRGKEALREAVELLKE